jgi:ketosteroid isomerase-like protein
MNDVEARIERLESRHQLADLAAAYCAAVDGKDARAVAELFTEAGALNDVDGRGAIQAFFERWMADTGPSFHYPHAQVLEFDGPDAATGVVTGHAEQRSAGETWVMGVRYEDRYRRQGGRWRFDHRRVTYRYRLRAAEYARRFGEVDR